MRILILAHHGLGDVIMTLPTIFNIIINRPRDIEKIYILVKSNNEKSIETIFDSSIKDKLKFISLGYNGKWKIKELLKNLKKIRKIKPDYFLNMHAFNIFIPLLLHIFSCSKKTVSIHNNLLSSLFFDSNVEFNENQHKIHLYSKLAEKIGLYSKLNELDLNNYLNNNLINNRKANFTQKYIVITPGSSINNYHKRWPSNKFSELINMIIENKDYYIVLLGIINEQTLLEDIKNNINNNYENRLKILISDNVIQTFQVINGAEVIISNCSAPIHIASFLKKKIIGIYGPTNYSFTGPFSPYQRIVFLNYKCSPCFAYDFTEGCGTPICIQDITVKQVYDEFEKLIAGEYLTYPQIMTKNIRKPLIN